MMDVEALMREDHADEWDSLPPAPRLRGRSRTGVGWLCFGIQATRTRLYLTVGPYTYWIDWRP